MRPNRLSYGQRSSWQRKSAALFRKDCQEPPYADPHVRWCGRREGQPSRRPDSKIVSSPNQKMPDPPPCAPDDRRPSCGTHRVMQKKPRQARTKSDALLSRKAVHMLPIKQEETEKTEGLAFLCSLPCLLFKPPGSVPVE